MHCIISGMQHALHTQLAWMVQGTAVMVMYLELCLPGQPCTLQGLMRSPTDIMQCSQCQWSHLLADSAG